MLKPLCHLAAPLEAVQCFFFGIDHRSPPRSGRPSRSVRCRALQVRVIVPYVRQWEQRRQRACSVCGNCSPCSLVSVRLISLIRPSHRQDALAAVSWTKTMLPGRLAHKKKLRLVRSLSALFARPELSSSPSSGKGYDIADARSE